MADKHDHLLDTAECLLRRGPMASISMEQVASAAGSSKATLYRHFRTREELIAAVIRRDTEHWRGWFLDTVREKSDGSPSGLIEAFFKVLRLWSEESAFTGLLSARSVMELRPVPPPAQTEFDRLCNDLRGFFRENLRKSGVVKPDTAAGWLSAMVLSVMANCPWIAAKAVPERWKLLQAQIELVSCVTPVSKPEAVSCRKKK